MTLLKAKDAIMEERLGGIDFPQVFIPITTSGFITLIVFWNAIISSLSLTLIHIRPYLDAARGTPNLHTYVLDQTHSQISRGHYLSNHHKIGTVSSAIRMMPKRNGGNGKVNAKRPKKGSLFSGIDTELTEEYEDVVNSYLNLLLAQEEAKCLRDFVSFHLISRAYGNHFHTIVVDYKPTESNYSISFPILFNLILSPARILSSA